MEIKIHTNISNELKEDEIEIVINASRNSNMLNKIIDNIQSITNSMDTIVGIKENNFSIINVMEVQSFYSKEQNNYCKTEKEEFRIKKKLYELEESLDKNTFIRISNSCIVNVKYIKSFDLSTIGNIVVKFLDGTSENVSKRRIPYVIKFLKERGN